MNVVRPGRNMMTPEEVKVVVFVYQNFMVNEDSRWSEIDDNLEMFEWLSNKEIITECEIKLKMHLRGTFRCTQDHEQEHCMSPMILDAVESIVKLYKETKNLHDKNKYILIYYLVLSEMKIIYSE